MPRKDLQVDTCSFLDPSADSVVLPGLSMLCRRDGDPLTGPSCSSSASFPEPVPPCDAPGCWLSLEGTWILSLSRFCTAGQPLCPSGIPVLPSSPLSPVSSARFMATATQILASLCPWQTCTVVVTTHTQSAFPGQALGRTCHACFF